jgi:hypothetical protein
MSFTVDDQLLLGALDASDSDCIVVASMRDLRCLCADVLSRREQPVVGLTLEVDGDAPVLACSDVRAVVGPGVRIYLIFSDELLYGLREMLGPKLAIDRGVARIWWPGAGARCDAGDHPAVLALDGEPCQITLEEFALRFDLTRPRVRGQITLIEDARAFLDHELARAREQNRRVHERLRDAQIECHALRARAEAAEASLAAAQRPPGLGRR